MSVTIYCLTIPGLDISLASAWPGSGPEGGVGRAAAPGVRREHAGPLESKCKPYRLVSYT